MHENRRSYLLRIVGAIVGAVGGTVALCGVIPTTWGVVGWSISLVSLIRALAIRPRTASSAEPPSVVWRVLLASLFVFCLIFLTAMATAGAANPQAVGFGERSLAWAMLALGTASAIAAIWLAWK
jgi:hypothetical protein